MTFSISDNVRISTRPVTHRCSCGRLLAIRIADRIVLKQRKPHRIAGGGFRIVCDGCKRLTVLAPGDDARAS